MKLNKNINFLVTGYGSLVGQAIIKTIRNSKYSNNLKIISTDYVENLYGQSLADKYYILSDVFKNKKLIDKWISEITNILNKNNIFIRKTHELLIIIS